MSHPRRTHAQARAIMREGILRLGREQLLTRGASGLSVREIARGLGVASSAVYRHVSSREELLTLLVVDAFTELADAVEQAVDRPQTSPPDPGARLRALSHSLRQWAVDNPSRWALIYGSPVPGYAAPADDTTPPGTRVMALFLGILSHGTPSNEDTPPSPTLSLELKAGATELGVMIPTPLMAEAVTAWTSLIGVISAEVFGQLGPGLTNVGGELLDRWATETIHRFSL